MPVAHKLRTEGSSSVLRINVALVLQDRDRFAHGLPAHMILSSKNIFRRKLVPGLDLPGQYLPLQLLNDLYIFQLFSGLVFHMSGVPPIIFPR